MPSITLKIPGIHCASCVARITDTLKKLPEVRDAQVSFATRSAVVEIQGHVPNSNLNLVRVPEFPKHGDTYRIQKQIRNMSPCFPILQALESIGYPAQVVTQVRAADVESELRKEAREWLLSACLGAVATILFMLGLLHDLGGFLIASLVMLVSGRKFLTRAWGAMASRNLTMDVLISMGTVAAYFTGLVSWAKGIPAHFYLESTVMILALISLGRYLETRTRVSAGGALLKLREGIPARVRRVQGKEEEDILVEALQPGDCIHLRMGEKVPVDGLAQDSGALINESFWTGQSEWRQVVQGTFVPAGCMVEQGDLTMRVEKIISESSLASMEQMVLEAQRSKASIERLVDRVSGVFVPVVLFTGIITFGAWIFLTGSWSLAAQSAVAVIIIACPCALGLATPTALMVGTEVGALMGIVIRNAKALEQLQKVGMILLDKTGTLTDGKPSLIRIVAKDMSEDEILRWALAAEHGATHPLAEAIRQEAKRRGIKAQAAGSARVERGYGVDLSAENHHVVVGKRDWLAQTIPFSLDDSALWESINKQGSSIVGVGVDGRWAGCLLFRDAVRPEAPAVVEALKRMGYKLAIVSGDQQAAVADVARFLGIQDLHHDKDPIQKSELVESYRASCNKKIWPGFGRDGGRGKVAFVGDGINDAVALSRADLGIAMGTGSDIAKESGDILLVKSDLTMLPTALRLGKSIFATIRQNLFWAFAYNVAMIPLAAFGKINPVMAAGAMALSSLSVVLNSLSIRWKNRLA